MTSTLNSLAKVREGPVTRVYTGTCVVYMPFPVGMSMHKDDNWEEVVPVPRHKKKGVPQEHVTQV